MDEHSTSDNGIGFQFSAFFQSSPGMTTAADQTAPTPAQQLEVQERLSAFIGFSWGPPPNAFARKSPTTTATPVGGSRRSSTADGASPSSLATPATLYLTSWAMHQVNFSECNMVELAVSSEPSATTGCAHEHRRLPGSVLGLARRSKHCAT